MHPIARRIQSILIVGLLLGLTLAQEEPAGSPRRVKAPVVAGQFYPEDAGELTRLVDGYMDAARLPEGVGRVRGLVSPHAGFIYSGPIAGHGYRLLREAPAGTYETVIILGPTHRFPFQGASLPDATHVETPLGLLEISPRAQEMLEEEIIVQVAAAHRREHSVETQYPFLQRALPGVQVIPLVLGDVDPVALADVLARYIDEKTLVVASSDLSHHLPYEQACRIDRFHVRAIEMLEPRLFELFSRGMRPCGRAGVATLTALARRLGWQAVVLDYRNSGDTAGGKERGVVGYTSIAFQVPEGEPVPTRPAYGPLELSEAEKATLLELARQAVEAHLAGEKAPDPPGEKLTDNLRAYRGTFVTLNKAGQLRGCIGSLAPLSQIWEGVVQHAQAAAFADQRFEEVQAEEMGEIEFEISILSLPEWVEYHTPEELLQALEPERDGVILGIGDRQATYLPQVWEQLPDPAEFLSRLSLKAGLSPQGWQRAAAHVFTYQAQVFHEPPRETR